ncbi:hypothetical protein Taro_053235 [Colocasia esculenta]|uniref:Uncharacterized protein n=1 Tax=Colocasia esculenta TaxID=4460 RepID=A0A843XKD2_COLES|nr:hypothetical protein [Colocasia esculenta]
MATTWIDDGDRPAIDDDDQSYKLCSWLAVIFCAQSLANMRNLENDLKQISMAMMFAIMGFVTNYMGPSRSAATVKR